MLRAIAKKIQPIWASIDNNNDGLKNRLIKGAAGSFGLKIAASGLAFILSIILARFLGTVGLGTYSYATTWANLLSIPATLGIHQLIVREIAIYRSKSQWGLMGGLLRWSNLMVLLSSIAFTLVAITVILGLKGSSDTTIVLAVSLAMLTVPVGSLRNLRLGAMQGLHKVVLGQMPDSLFAPIITILLTSFSYFLFSENFNVFWVLTIKIVAVLITFVIGSRWLLGLLPLEVKKIKPQYAGKQWLVAALPFMFLGTLGIINSRIDIIMLGGFKGVEAVGIYTVIVGIAQLTSFIHQSVNSVIGPNIATLYSEGKFEQLEKLVQKSVLAVFLMSLLICGILIFSGNYVLLIFGSEFVFGRHAMNILIIGQMFNALTGPVGLVLNMTGYQKHTAIAAGSSAVLNIILNYILIPQWGINGAAIATTTSLITINSIKVLFMQKKLNISLYSIGYKKQDKP